MAECVCGETSIRNCPVHGQGATEAEPLSRWIVVTNWDRFQHPDALRTEGIRPWFKVYTKLAHNPDFGQLTELERGLLLTIWVEFASSDGQLTATRLSKACHDRARKRSLDRLIQAGFITLSASRPLASSKQNARPEEIREEKNPPTPLTGTNRNNGRPRRTEEVPAMIDIVTACQHFIEGQAWDETWDKDAIVEEFGRIQRGRRTQGDLTVGDLVGLLEQWAATRQDRHGIPANLGAQ